MASTFWHKQQKEPSFPDLLWDKPEVVARAGKLLIIGGNAHSFTAPAEAYNYSTAAKAGVVRVLLPDVLKKIVGPIIEQGEFAPSTQSGSFNKAALATWLDAADWSDGVLLPGDLSRNSETAITLESFIKKYSGLVTITKDALDYFTVNPSALIDRDNTVVVASFAQLQKLSVNSKFTKAFTFDMTLHQLVDNLHLFTTVHPTAVVLRHNNIFLTAKDGEVSTTPTTELESKVWRVKTAAVASVWAMQNPNKLFAAITTAIYELTH